MVADQLAYLGRNVRDQLQGFGLFARFAWSALRWSMRGAWSFGRVRLLMPQLYMIGTTSIPVVMLVGAFVGAVLGIESYAQLEAIGQETRLGGIISVSVVKQIGPVLAAVMIAGRVGGAVSAELGTMRVTEQLDALRVMGADPVAYLVVPRVLACVLMLPVLTVFSDVLGIFGAWLVVVRGFEVDAAAYWQFTERFVSNWEVFVGLGKSVVFGLAIGLISCFKGFYCQPGAAGVGRAATDSFVTSFIAIIISNFFLAKFFNDLYIMIYGHGGPTAFSG
ncbi:MAG: MlaE family lipid ABC transporter permease subunit [Planctomycetes bacterium]|jgi:phospholipid/cholesterol/gamma-HCH transport system permease protein|nr:MlaE family lipid ABC transporter permease subunit [Planctomycetota bacterium]